MNVLRRLIPQNLMPNEPQGIDRKPSTSPGLFQFGAELCVPALTIFILFGCEGNTPAAAQPDVDYVIDEETSERTLIAHASVLIIERPEAQASVPSLIEIRVTPDTIIVDQGESIQLSADGLDSKGREVQDVEIRWAVSDGRVGRVNKNGQLTASVDPGFYERAVTIVAVQNTPSGVKTVTDSKPVTIVGDARIPELAEVAIASPNATLLKGQLFQMRATAFDEEGFPIPGAQIRWTLEKKIGRINKIGQIRVDGKEGLYEKGVRVTATWQGQTKIAHGNIKLVDSLVPEGVLNLGIVGRRVHLESGAHYKFEAMATDGAGEIISNVPIRWYLDDQNAGYIDNEGNFVAGRNAGVYTEAIVVEAAVPSADGFLVATDYASVVVRGGTGIGRLKAVRVMPRKVKIAPGGRTTFIVEAVDGKGGRARNVTWWWSTIDESVGTITPLGAFTAGDRPGTYSKALRVTVEQELNEKTVVLSKAVDVTIMGTLERLVIEPTRSKITVGKTINFSVTAYDENDIVLSGVVILWSVSDVRVGTIDVSGTFTAGSRIGQFNNVVRAEVIQVRPDLP